MAERVKRAATIAIEHESGVRHDGLCDAERGCLGLPVMVFEVGCGCPDEPHGECSAVKTAVTKFYTAELARLNADIAAAVERGEIG